MTGRENVLGNEKSYSMKRIMIVGGSAIAFSIGSGFATGQEVLQYFAAYGFMGFLAIILFATLNTYANWQFIEAGRIGGMEKASQVYNYFCGKYIGAFYDWFSIVFCFMSYVVMVAGAGATLNQHYGIPEIPGAIIVAVLAGVTVMFGLNRMLDIIGRIGPLIIMLAIVAAIFGIAFGETGIAQGNALVTQGQVDMMRAGSSWYSSALSYLGFGMLWFAAFFAAIGKREKNVIDAKAGAVVHSGLLGVAVAMVMLALLGNLQLVLAEGAQIPLLKVLDNVNHTAATVFSIIIFLGIYTTACPLLWTPCQRLGQEGTARYRMVTIILTVLGLVIGLALPFNKLVNIIYVINGYVGFILLFFIIVKHIRVALAKKAAGRGGNYGG